MQITDLNNIIKKEHNFKINSLNNSSFTVWKKDIYIVKRSHNWYKIGVSNNVNNRVYQMQVCSPEKLTCIASVPLQGMVYYIERKANENKLFIEFELTSALALQEVKLPGRVVTSDACAWTYRGEGCCYEYNSLKSASVHGDASLPNFAPPLANEKNELIEESIPEYDPADWRGNVPPLWKGSSESGGSYSKGSVVRILVKGVNYYFVAKTTVPVDAPPPNDKFWMADQCSKKVTGCKWRWGTYSATNDHGAGSPPVSSGGGNPKNGHLPFGGFPGVTSGGEYRIYGELYEVDDDTFERLDDKGVAKEIKMSRAGSKEHTARTKREDKVREFMNSDDWSNLLDNTYIFTTLHPNIQERLN